MKKRIIFFLPFLATTHLSVPEFWMQPDKFIYDRTESMNIKFLEGENFNGNNWTGGKDTVNSLQLYFENAVDKNLDENLGTDSGDSLQLAMFDEGTVMLTLDTKNSFVDLEAGDFNKYLRENDLKEAIEYRQKNGDTLKNGLENIRRSLKTFLQVGSRFTKVYNKKTNLALDIIPLDHPYNPAKDKRFNLQIFFMGDKLKNTKVKVWHKVDDTVSEQDYTTDEEGKVGFILSSVGEWMVSCVKTIRLENDPWAEWQNYWSSLTWGYY